MAGARLLVAYARDDKSNSGFIDRLACPRRHPYVLLPKSTECPQHALSAGGTTVYFLTEMRFS